MNIAGSMAIRNISVLNTNRLDAIFVSRLNNTEVTTENIAAGIKACIIITAITVGSGFISPIIKKAVNGTATNFITAKDRCSFLRFLISRFVKFIPRDR